MKKQQMNYELLMFDKTDNEVNDKKLFIAPLESGKCSLVKKVIREMFNINDAIMKSPTQHELTEFTRNCYCKGRCVSLYQ